MRNIFLNITTKKIQLNKIIVTVTIIAILLGLILPEAWIDDLIVPIAFVLILAGIPHGASDFVIFQRLFGSNNIISQLLYFGAGYITIVLLYAILWLVYPTVAFILFLINAIYHFGESNWNYLEVNQKWLKHGIYLLWGTAILAIPILLGFEQAAIIIEEITGKYYSISSNIRASLIYLLCFSNWVLITSLFDHEYITKEQFFQEIGHFTLLILLFFSTPLLIGFGIYFVFWHSMYAMRDQFLYLELRKFTERRKDYIRQLVLISMVSFVGIGLLYALANNSIEPEYNLGKLFVFIAVVTVPHSLLMHNLYQFNIFQEKTK